MQHIAIFFQRVQLWKRRSYTNSVFELFKNTVYSSSSYSSSSSSFIVCGFLFWGLRNFFPLSHDFSFITLLILLFFHSLGVSTALSMEKLLVDIVNSKYCVYIMNNLLYRNKNENTRKRRRIYEFRPHSFGVIDWAIILFPVRVGSLYDVPWLLFY